MNRFRRTAAAAAFGIVATAAALPARAQTAAGGFPDVPAGHWASQSIGKLAGAGVVKGYPGGPLAVAQAKPAPKKPGQTKAAYDGNKPVTRYELAVTLYRFIVYIERAERQKKSNTGAWLQGEPKSGAEAVKKMVAMGYLPKNTPLATEGGKYVTANQMADALALVISKTREKVAPLSKGSMKDIEKPNVGI